MMRPSTAAGGGVGGAAGAGGLAAAAAGDARAAIARQGELIDVLLECSAQAAAAGTTPPAAAAGAASGSSKGGKASAKQASGKGAKAQAAAAAASRSAPPALPPPAPWPPVGGGGGALNLDVGYGWELTQYSLDEIAAATDCFNPAKVAGRGLYGPLFEATLRGRSVIIKRIQLDPDTLAATSPPLPLLTHLRAEAKAHVLSARAARRTGMRDVIFDARTSFPFAGRTAVQARWAMGGEEV